MHSEQQIKERFSNLLGLLPSTIQSAIKDNWDGNSPLIIADSRSIDRNPFGKVTIAGTTGRAFFFRPEKIRDDRLDEIILHELAHAYLLARDQISILDWKEHTALQDRHEREATRLEREWLRDHVGRANAG